MSTDFIPATEAAFYTWVGVVVSYLRLNLGRFGIADVTYNDLRQLYDAFRDKYDRAADPATRTPVAITERKVAQAALTAALRPFLKGYVTYNPAVTEGDKRAMELPLHQGGHTPVPVPTTYPDVTVDSSVIRRLTFHFRDHDSEHKARPHGVAGAVVRWAILEAPPADVDELPNSALDTASPYTLDFTEAQRGKWVYACLAWQNPKGEKGPWSEIVSAIVP